MILLDLVPAYKRHIRQYVLEQDTDSQLAAYLADAVEALNWRWTRDYEITLTAPSTYEVDPDIVAKDKRPIILMASIIYKGANFDTASFRDGDFAYDPAQGKYNPMQTDIDELNKLVPAADKRLARAKTSPMRGFSNAYNPESYAWLALIGVPGQVV